jgi:glyoxylase I family protein
MASDSSQSVSEPVIGRVTPLLEVFDMQQSLRFYRDLLGFKVVSSSPEMGWCMLQSGSVYVMLNAAYDADDERPEQPVAERQRWHRDLTLYFDADPNVVHARLVESGWNVRPPYAAPYGMLQLNTEDPDGYSIAFVMPLDAAAKT